MSAVCVLPTFLQMNLVCHSSEELTLIVVGVALDTVQQIESHLITRNHALRCRCFKSSWTKGIAEHEFDLLGSAVSREGHPSAAVVRSLFRKCRLAQPVRRSQMELRSV